MRRMQQLSAVVGSAVFILLFITYCFFPEHLDAARQVHPWHNPIAAPLNASLGFGKVLMISLPSRTDRRDAMSLAFQVSGMEPAEYIAGLRGEDVADVAKPLGSDNVNPANLGSWRAHANAWKRIVDEGWSTALILEDDTDWDIDIKLQLNLMSKAMKAWGRTDITKDHPYGKNWDLFMFGHCLEGHFNKSEEAYFIYPDSTVLPVERQSRTNRQVLEDFEVPEGHRVLSRGYKPICTMGYALTHEGAQRLLYKYSVKQMSGPIDIEIMVGCEGRSIRCLEVNPALIGVFREAGPSKKLSDIDTSGSDAWVPRDNPMGDRSAKSLLGDFFDGLVEV